MERRTILTGAGIALSTLFSGCLGTDLSLDDEEIKDEPTPDDSTFEYDTFQVGALRATNNPLSGNSIGSLNVFTEATDAYEELPLDDVDDRLLFDDLAEGQSGAAEDFIEDTEFPTELLVSVVTEWPKSNPSGIDVRELEKEGKKITGTVEAVGKDPDIGDDAPSYPLTLIRTTVGSEVPESVELTIIDGSKNEGTADVRVK